jgi:hypothetical protein
MYFNLTTFGLMGCAQCHEILYNFARKKCDAFGVSMCILRVFCELISEEHFFPDNAVMRKNSHYIMFLQA